MKKSLIIVLSILAAFVIFGCDLAFNDSAESKVAGVPVSLDVEVSGVGDSGSKATINDDANVSKVYIKVFTSARALVSPTSGGSLTETGATELTKSGSVWSGTVNVTNPGGTIYFLAYGVTAGGAHLYSGVGSTGAASGKITIAAAPGFTTGGTSATNFGPGGGYVFLISGGRYYELAPTDASPGVIWGPNPSTAALAANGTAIGTGTTNTTTIITAHPTGNAAVSARNYNNGGYSSTSGSLAWFLPSTLEMTEVYNNTTVRGFAGLNNSPHWTSTYASNNNAFSRNPTSVTVASSVVKSSSLYARAIRSFPAQ